jgi:hypothetical protein
VASARQADLKSALENGVEAGRQRVVSGAPVAGRSFHMVFFMVGGQRTGTEADGGVGDAAEKDTPNP